MTVTILPVSSPDLPTLVDFVHASKLCLTINRLLYLNWPNDAAQRRQYKQAVESSFNNEKVMSLKAVDDETKELVGYLVLTPKQMAEANPTPAETAESETQGVPQGMHPGVLAAVEDVAAKINRAASTFDHLELTWIYVKPSHRNRGVGSVLLKEAQRRARLQDVHIALCTEPAAYEFYKKRGFKDTMHADIDLCQWAPPYSGFGVFRLSGMTWNHHTDAIV
ncbi:hypothetical protein FDECE_9937 [Fusarium decemcellulare]|nr:hypothetical protein FDECE_9937 [Fusarium decemcellulare]